MLTNKKLPLFTAFVGSTLSLVAVLGTASISQAAPTYYVGYDTNASTFTTLESQPTSTSPPDVFTARNTFLNNINTQHLGTVTNYDFGNLAAPANQDVSGGINAGNGLTISFSNTAANLDAGVASISTSQNNGFSTVSSTGPIVFLQPSANNSTVTFTFANGVDAFGIFLTGLGNNGAVAPVTITFSDGTSETYSTEGSIDSTYSYNGATFTNGPDNTNAGAEFFGFTDSSNAKITNITFTQNPGDKHAFDNIYFTTVPEPSTVAIYTIGSMILLGLVYRRRKTVKFAKAAC